jgi:hypothetical protein
MAFIYLEQIKEDWQTTAIKDFININHIVFFRADFSNDEHTYVHVDGVGSRVYNIKADVLSEHINKTL